MKGHRDVNARSPSPRASGYWVFGINAVARRLESRPESLRELRLLAGEQGRRAVLRERAKALGLSVRDSDKDELHRLTGSEAHQGIAALAGPFPYSELRSVVANDPGPLLMLDQVQDPHNLGALVRTAAATGMTGVIIPRHGAAGVSGAVEKVAAGAVNDVPICQVANLHRTLLDLRDLGYWAIALDAAGAPSLFDIELPARPILVLGGESGMRSLVSNTCDLRASIPQRPAVESLNASVAGAIAMYDVCRRLDRLDRI